MRPPVRRQQSGEVGNGRERACYQEVGAEVVLNLYDYNGDAMVHDFNTWGRYVGLGAFHAAVEVYGLEWSYGFTEGPDAIYSCMPKSNSSHQYRESIPLGVTFFSMHQVERLLHQMGKEWPGQSYNLLWRNCCHFADDLSQRLGVGAIPQWVTPTLGIADERSSRPRMHAPGGA